jgi:hypothetical protein
MRPGLFPRARLSAACVLFVCTVSLASGGEAGSGAGLRPGHPDRAGETDILRGFKEPPPGYGEVAFYWWVGDTLSKERLLWQMDQLAGRGVSGLQVNYAHTDTGGFSYGRTMPSQPPLFSDAWWDLFRWFLGEARKRGMSVSLSDYTLGRAGQGWYVDEMLRDTPSLKGAKLACVTAEAAGGSRCTIDTPEGTLLCAAYRSSADTLVPESRIDLGPFLRQGRLAWDVPAGSWRVLFIHRVIVPASLDPMHPQSGSSYVSHFFQRFEDRCPGEAGTGLNFFFSDELDFGIRGWLWKDSFGQEFATRKGYDIVPELAALFADCGPRTPKVRMDYNDVMVSLSEEHFFKPLYTWHAERGMLFGCDHGGRGTDVTEFGDYFRTQRWISGPGCDQPALARDIVKNKVASSIAHLYERPRTWLEGYHSSGWGTSSAEIADATFANFGMGQNLLSLHGLYYSTHGSRWEWAPPDNHFRQPYWEEMPGLLRCVERLSYLLSQGVHRCDVAVVYPVAPAEAGTNGDASVKMAFDAARALYGAGIDLDFIDHESVLRAQIANGALEVAGERYRVLIMPAMSAVRYAMMEKVRAFAAAGGTVIALGSLPSMSDRAGRCDPALDALVRDVFGMVGPDGHAIDTQQGAKSAGVVLRDTAWLVTEVEKTVPRDCAFAIDPAHPVQVLHRAIGQRDVYYLYGARKGTEVRFRMKGKVELWDPWTGTVRSLPVLSTDRGETRILTPLAETEPQLFVFSPGTPVLEKPAKREAAASEIPLGGEWTFRVVPTMDNRWGDFRLPAFDGVIGPEASTMLYREETGNRPVWQLPWLVEDSAWTPVSAGFGPQFMKLGPLPADAKSISRRFAQVGAIDQADTIEVHGRMFTWSPYEFSWRWGLKGEAGHQGYHGLKGIVHDDQITFGLTVRTWRGVPGPRYENESDGSVYYFWSTVYAARAGWGTVRRSGVTPKAIWVNNERVDTAASRLRLYRGVNTLLLRYEGAGAGAFVVDTAVIVQRPHERVPMSSLWFNTPTAMRFDPMPDPKGHVGWYRFTAPPGVRSLRFAAHGAVRLWVNGAGVTPERDTAASARFPVPGATLWRVMLPVPEVHAPVVALRIELERGAYGGSAIPEPVTFVCDSGAIACGDLTTDRALSTYSGGLLYSRTVTLTRPQAAMKRITLDLGALVSSARVRVNGIAVGERATPPWQFDLSRKVKPGLNRIEVLVHTTLGNHYQTVPTPYAGSSSAGLIGPAVLRIGE